MPNFFTHLSAQSNGVDIDVRPLTPPLFAPPDAHASALEEMTPRYRSHAPLIRVAPTLLDLANSLEQTTDQERDLPGALVTDRTRQHTYPTALHTIANQVTIVQFPDEIPTSVFPTLEISTSQPQQPEISPSTMIRSDQPYTEQSQAIVQDTQAEILLVQEQEKKSSFPEVSRSTASPNEQPSNEYPTREQHTQSPHQSSDKPIMHRPEPLSRSTIQRQPERTPDSAKNIAGTLPINNAITIIPTPTKTNRSVETEVASPHRSQIKPGVTPDTDDVSAATLAHMTTIMPAFEKPGTTQHSSREELATVTSLTGEKHAAQREYMQPQRSVRRDIEKQTSVTWPLITPLLEDESSTSSEAQTYDYTKNEPGPVEARVTRSSVRKQWAVRTQQAMPETGQITNAKPKEAEPQAPPTFIQVHIGRVEVRTTPPAPRQTPRSVIAPRPTLTLSEYLQQRKRDLQ